MPPFNKFLGKIQIPMRLDLAQTNISFTNQEFCYKYILKCVVFHIGRSQSQGHYTSNLFVHINFMLPRNLFISLLLFTLRLVSKCYG